MKQETSSAVEDGAEWRMGKGIRGLPLQEVGLILVKSDLTPS